MAVPGPAQLLNAQSPQAATTAEDPAYRLYRLFAPIGAPLREAKLTQQVEELTQQLRDALIANTALQTENAALQTENAALQEKVRDLQEQPQQQQQRQPQQLLTLLLQAIQQRSNQQPLSTTQAPQMMVFPSAPVSPNSGTHSIGGGAPLIRVASLPNTANHPAAVGQLGSGSPPITHRYLGLGRATGMQSPPLLPPFASVGGSPVPQIGGSPIPQTSFASSLAGGSTQSAAPTDLATVQAQLAAIMAGINSRASSQTPRPC